MEIYAAPKLPKYTTALGADNIKSFTYEINQRAHAWMETTHGALNLQQPGCFVRLGRLQ